VAGRAITRFFFDNSVYFRLLDVASAAGLTIPIVPGIFPVQNFKQTASFARRAGTSVPRWLAAPVRRPRRRSRDPPPRRGRRLRRTGDRPHRPRRRGFTLLYDVPRRSRIAIHLIGRRAKPRAAAEAA
jgi:hypothetical protein